jgi:hypothetical protein
VVSAFPLSPATTSTTMKMARRGRDRSSCRELALPRRCGGGVGGFDCFAARTASGTSAAVRLSSSSTSTDGNDAASASVSSSGGFATSNGTAAVAAPMDPASSLSSSAGVVQGDQVSERTRMTSTNPDGASAAASSSYAMSHDAGSLLDIDPSAVEIVAVETATSSSSSRKPTGDDDASKQVTGTQQQQQQGDTVRSTSTSPPSTSSSSSSSTSASDSAAASFLRQLPFVSMFRNSANYIANHRGTTAVYHIPGTLLDLEDPNMFRDLMNDVALTWLLGMKIVLVVGCRHQIERRIGTILGLRDDDRLYGLRVTNEETLRIVKEEAGYVRFEVERQLARSLRVQGTGTAAGATTAQTGASGNKFGNVMVNGAAGGGGGAAGASSHTGGGEHSTISPSGGGDGGYYDGNVVSGNFYSAQPFGILDGVDYST